MSVIVVHATWDPEAEVWVAESADVPGLATEAATLPLLVAKLPGMIQDLLEDDNAAAEEVDIPVEIIASLSTKVRAAVAA